MKNPGGGTNIYCPKCEVVRECRVPNDLGLEKSENYYFQDSTGETYFRRNRECITCGQIFETFEIWSGSPRLSYLPEWQLLQEKVKKLEQELASLEGVIVKRLDEFSNPKKPTFPI